MAVTGNGIMFENERTWGKFVDNNSTDEFHKKFDNAVEEIRKTLEKVTL